MPMTDAQPVQYRPIGGLNTVDSEDLLDDYEVKDANNFLFERRQAVVRPPMHLDGALTGAIASLVLRAQGMMVGGNYDTFIQTADGKVWISGIGGLSAASLGVTQINGAALTLPGVPFNMATVNNAFLSGGNTTGLIRSADLANYTLIADAKYAYVASHISRAVAAYDYAASMGYAKFAWSVAGNETDWTSAGSGSSVIADISEFISGLAVLHNVVVIFHKAGIHLASPTGVSNPAFRIDTWNKGSTGCAYPDTLAVDNNVAFFAGPDNLYMFDLQNLTPIGNKVQNLITALNLSKWRGVITKGVQYDTYQPILSPYSEVARARYHLIPKGDPTAPWLIYDIQDGTWSKHSSSINVKDAGSFGGLAQYPTFLDNSNPPKLYSWSESLSSEEAAYIVSKTLTIGNIESDYQVVRLLVRSRDFGNGDMGNATATVDSVLNLQSVISSGAINIPVGFGNTQRWVRQWCDLRQVGQDFRVRIDVPAGRRFAVNYLSLQAEESGEFRGV